MISKRSLTSLASSRGTFPSDFHFFPDFFTSSEQRTLLQAALLKLDAAGSRRFQRKRKAFLASTKDESSMFLPDGYYEFSEAKGHYDGVIHNYREMLLDSWPLAEIPALSPVINRLHSLLPSQSVQTHLLHLASNGAIQPHVDNVGASGRWILGASLGSKRILRLESCENDEGPVVDIPLSPGSVYIQSDSVRFQYKHSILKECTSRQRISVMIRDLPDNHGHLPVFR